MARALKLVDPDTGELVDPQCPTCSEWARKYQGVLSQLGQLRADKDAEARADEAWPLALRLFNYHNKVFAHPRAQWTVERFEMVRKRLKASGLEDCLRAIAGHRTNEWALSRGLTMFEDVFGSQVKFERALLRCPKDWEPPKGMPRQAG